MNDGGDDRFVVTAGRRTLGVVITLGEVKISVKMPPAQGMADMSPEMVRQTALRQLKRALEVAREEIG